MESFRTAPYFLTCRGAGLAEDGISRQGLDIPAFQRVVSAIKPLFSRETGIFYFLHASQTRTIVFGKQETLEMCEFLGEQNRQRPNDRDQLRRFRRVVNVDSYERDLVTDVRRLYLRQQ